MRSLIFALLTLGLTPALVACGAQPKPVGLAPSSADQPAEQSATFKIQIASDVALMKTNVDETGSPKFYLVNGALVRKPDGVQSLLAGNVLCYAKISGYSPKAGDYIDTQYTNASGVENGRTLQYMNITSVDTANGASFALVCMKLRAAVKPSDVRTAFRTVLRF